VKRLTNSVTGSENRPDQALAAGISLLSTVAGGFLVDMGFFFSRKREISHPK
jgi:predicted sugar kinase